MMELKNKLVNLMVKNKLEKGSIFRYNNEFTVITDIDSEDIQDYNLDEIYLNGIVINNLKIAYISNEDVRNGDMWEILNQIGQELYKKGYYGIVDKTDHQVKDEDEYYDELYIDIDRDLSIYTNSNLWIQVC